MTRRFFTALAGFTLLSIAASDASAMYDPALGRFISRDPIEYDDGPNMYQYVRGRPLVYVDPSGNCADSVCEDDEYEIVLHQILYVKIADYELKQNIKKVEIGPKLVRVDTPIEIATKGSVLTVLEREKWDVTCCHKKDRSSSRFIKKERVKLPKPLKPVVIQRTLPISVFTLTRTNMKAYVDYWFPVPLWVANRGAKSNQNTKCLSQAKPDRFSGIRIDKDTKVPGGELRQNGEANVPKR